MDYGVQTIKRQTGCVRLVGHRSAYGRRLSLRPICPTPAKCVTWTAPLQLRYVAWWATQVLYAFIKSGLVCTKISARI